MNASVDKSLLHTTLRKMGNSTGMVLPKPILDQLGLTSGAKIQLRVEDGEVIARPVRRKVREGWEEAARQVASSRLTDEERDWLDMPSDFGSEWEW